MLAVLSSTVGMDTKEVLKYNICVFILGYITSIFIIILTK